MRAGSRRVVRCLLSRTSELRSPTKTPSFSCPRPSDAQGRWGRGGSDKGREGDNLSGETEREAGREDEGGPCRAGWLSTSVVPKGREMRWRLSECGRTVKNTGAQVPSAVAWMSRTLHQNNKEEPDPVTSKEAVSPDIRATPRFGLMPARYRSRTVLGVGPFVLSRWDPEHQGTMYGGGTGHLTAVPSAPQVCFPALRFEPQARGNRSLGSCSPGRVSWAVTEDPALRRAAPLV